MVDDALERLSERLDALYAGEGRPSIPPERLLRASLLQILYSVRSEKLLMEQLQYNLLFRWFVGLGIDDPVWNPSTFSKNRDRLLDAELSQELLQAVLAPARDQNLLSTDHFSVDGTLVESWASYMDSSCKGRNTFSMAWRTGRLRSYIRPRGGTHRSRALMESAHRVPIDETALGCLEAHRLAPVPVRPISP